MNGFTLPDWERVFVPDISLAESFLRGTVVYLSLLVLFRLVLKRQAGKLGLPELLLLGLVSACVSRALTGPEWSVPNALVAVSALLLWNYALDRLGHRWPWFRRLLAPEPLPLVRDETLIRENMDAEGISEDELE